MKLKRTLLGPVLVASIAVMSGGWLLQRGVAEQTGVFQNSRLFEEVLQAISNRYVDQHSSADLYRMAVEGMLRELGDPHTTFMSAEEYANLRAQTTGEYGGLGIEIVKQEGWITVLSILPDTPAERAGLLPGDRIVEVEGESTSGWSTDQAVRVLRGPKGQPVNIRIGRSGVEQAIPFEIVRDEIHILSVPSYYLMGDGVGYIQLQVFSETSTEELQGAIESLRGQGMQRLVLDLRGNPGGLLDQAITVSDLFLGRGAPISETRSRDPRETRTYRAARGEQYPDLPIIVLVNGSSASASEIVAGALQDNDRALVLGTPSFGKGSVQSLYPLSGGNFLKLTTGRWYTPVGRSIERDHRREGDPVALLEEETMEDDEVMISPDLSPEPVDTAGRQQYRTAGGRLVYGGGGIVPDMIVRPDTATLAEQEFFAEASKAGSAYIDVLYRYAQEFARANPNLQRNFQITSAMREEFYRQLRASEVPVDRENFDAAQRLIDRDLTFQIALNKFGRPAAIQRRNEQDNVIQRASELLRGAANTQTLLQASQQQASRR